MMGPRTRSGDNGVIYQQSRRQGTLAAAQWFPLNGLCMARGVLRLLPSTITCPPFLRIMEMQPWVDDCIKRASTSTSDRVGRPRWIKGHLPFHILVREDQHGSKLHHHS